MMRESCRVPSAAIAALDSHPALEHLFPEHAWTTTDRGNVFCQVLSLVCGPVPSPSCEGLCSLRGKEEGRAFT
jgi:hypothetical protein